MKKILLFSFLCFFSPEPLHAQTRSDQFAPTIGLGAEVYGYHYKEPSLMHDDGILYGVNASFSIETEAYLALEGRYSFGSVNYKSESTGSIDNIRYRTLEFRVLIGKRLHLDRNFSLLPYAGVGYRNLTDYSGGAVSSTNSYGYDRNSQYYYLPIGASFIFKTSAQFEIAPRFEYDFFISGTQKSYLSQVDPGFNDLENDQSNGGYGYRANLDVKLNTNGGVIKAIVFSPFYRFWKIHESKRTAITFYGKSTGYVGVEPNNNTREYGASFAFLF